MASSLQGFPTCGVFTSMGSENTPGLDVRGRNHCASGVPVENIWEHGSVYFVRSPPSTSSGQNLAVLHQLRSSPHCLRDSVVGGSVYKHRGQILYDYLILRR